ncbi:MAG: hypothetical protein HOY79_50035 [Streptomyces sp.]|nr:hypothetical protein [Streptomyces sp.]
MPAPPQPRHLVPDHIPEHLHEAFATTKGRTPPDHSPYKPGDAVQLHGFGGEMPGHRRTGFRGWVVACIGATILTGITTEGEEWAEYWGRLQPDGLPVNLSRWCTCCREERRALLSAHGAKHGEQLDMFDLEAS